MMVNKHLILVLGIILFLFTACGKQPASNSPTPFSPATPTAIKQPEPGKAMVTGKIISTITNKPLETAVWLAEVHRQGDQGAYVLNAVTSPGIYADENGIFVLLNISPQEYVIVVGELEGQNEVIKDSSGKPKVWNIPADQIFDTGELRVGLTK
jgi:hypothetical protein